MANIIAVSSSHTSVTATLSNEHKSHLAAAASGTTASDFTEDSRSVHRGLLGVFGRGFFARPVYHSKQENYRYLMALDR